MSSKKILIILGALIVLAGLVIGIFFVLGYTTYRNNMVDAEEKVIGSWAEVENKYQRRADLIPNLVKTVEAEATFEKSTLTDVIEARAKATQVKIDPSNMSAAQLKQFSQAQQTLGSTLSRLMMTVERYPQLQANQAFKDLRVALAGAENRISVARGRFINATRVYNTMIRKFPYSLFSGMFGFERRPNFEAEAGAEKAPEVDINIE